MTNFNENVDQLVEWSTHAIDKLEQLHSERWQMFRLGMWVGVLIGAAIVSMTVIVFGG